MCIMIHHWDKQSSWYNNFRFASKNGIMFQLIFTRYTLKTITAMHIISIVFPSYMGKVPMCRLTQAPRYRLTEAPMHRLIQATRCTLIHQTLNVLISATQITADNNWYEATYASHYSKLLQWSLTAAYKSHNSTFITTAWIHTYIRLPAHHNHTELVYLQQHANNTCTEDLFQAEQYHITLMVKSYQHTLYTLTDTNSHITFNAHKHTHHIDGKCLRVSSSGWEKSLILRWGKLLPDFSNSTWWYDYSNFLPQVAIVAPTY